MHHPKPLVTFILIATTVATALATPKDRRAAQKTVYYGDTTATRKYGSYQATKAYGYDTHDYGYRVKPVRKEGCCGGKEGDNLVLPVATIFTFALLTGYLAVTANLTNIRSGRSLFQREADTDVLLPRETPVLTESACAAYERCKNGDLLEDYLPVMKGLEKSNWNIMANFLENLIKKNKERLSRYLPVKLTSGNDCDQQYPECVKQGALNV